MKTINIIKPIKLSKLSVNKNISEIISGRYEISSVLSFPVMLYSPVTADISRSGISNNINVNVSKSDPSLFFKASLINLGNYSRMRKSLNSAVTLRNLFRSNNALNHLVDALWSIYKSNNLRLSHSLLKLIRLITEKNNRDYAADNSVLSHIMHVQKKVIKVLKNTDFTLVKHISALHRNISVSDNKTKEIYSSLNSAEHYYNSKSVAVSDILSNSYTMTPLLEHIYESIESGMYLYNDSSYKNAKTLYRLTNSLWKVYLGQNLELSRSFSRLIKRVSEENESIEYKNRENNLFSTSGSLKNLVNALRQAFTGNNLELRNSMIDLFGNINQAVKQRNIKVSRKNSFKSTVNIKLMHRDIIPVRENVRMIYKKGFLNNDSETKNKYSSFEQETKKKLKEIESKFSGSSSDNIESMIKTVLDRINKEQRIEWRLEILQRGIF